LLDGLFVFVTAVIHQPAHGGFCVGSYLYEVEVELLCEPDRLIDFLDSDLLSVRGHNTDLFGPDGSVHTQFADADTSCRWYE